MASKEDNLADAASDEVVSDDFTPGLSPLFFLQASNSVRLMFVCVTITFSTSSIRDRDLTLLHLKLTLFMVGLFECAKISELTNHKPCGCSRLSWAKLGVAHYFLIFLFQLPNHSYLSITAVCS
jgi:hypothetical protein